MRLTKYEPNEQSMFPYKLRDEELSTELDSIHKLGQLEDIEDELGIGLITLFKALKQGIYFKNEYSKEKEIVFVKPILSTHFDLYVNPLCIFQLGSYGKIWALTKEELK